MRRPAGRSAYTVSAVLLAVVAIGALALLQPVQETGCTQTSQLALTRAFDEGTARIDKWQQTTCDKAWFGGHFYSVKAPGLAAAVLPAFALLHAVHAVPASDRTTIWLLSVLTVLPAAVVLALLVGAAADRVEPGSGVLAAAALVTGTMVLPFGTLWFGHVPAAALAFGSFALLQRGRAGASRRLDGVAGLVAATAVLFEYPVAIVAGMLAVYTFARRGANAGLAFLAGAAAPAVVLLAYNRWAFGSVTHFSYADAVTVSGDTGHDVIGANSAGLFGITRPSAHAFADLLFAPRGLLTLTPICLLGAVGLVLVYRRARAEALLAGCVIAAVLLYNSGLTTPFGGPFGGDSPGPRYLVIILPFLLFGVGAAASRFPGTTVALLVASAGAMVVATATQPMVGSGETHVWLDRLRHGSFTHTLVTLLGGGGRWPAVVPFAVLCAALVVLASRQVLARPTGLHTAFEAASLLLAWLLVLYGSSLVYAHHRKALGLTAFVIATAIAGVGVGSRVFMQERAPAP